LHGQPRDIIITIAAIITRTSGNPHSRGAQMATGYRLYGRRGSGSFAVQVALEESGAPYELIWIGQEPQELARLRLLNPAGKVPVLVLPDGSVMIESAAMLIHLALAFPHCGLAPPPGTSRHAAFLQWMVFLSANVYEAVLRMYYAPRFSSRGEADAQPIMQQGSADFVSNLGLICAHLGPYVLGGEYSIADVYLYMLGTWWQGDKAELHARFPMLGAHAARMQARPAVAKAEAEHAA
jgi:glutathione S-transferase